jgi:hypothetical protein
MDTAISAYLVPTAAGARFAVAAARQDARRTILLGLLRGAASRPVPLTRLAELAGMPDRKAVGGLLFKMQRAGWLSGDVEPMRLPRAPLAEALPALLAALAPCGRAVLAAHDGLCVAWTGFERTAADRLAAVSAGLFPIARNFEERHDAETGAPPASWTLCDTEREARLTIRPLYIGPRPFHLALAGGPDTDDDAFVQLIALLSRRYLGEC